MESDRIFAARPLFTEEFLSWKGAAKRYLIGHCYPWKRILKLQQGGRDSEGGWKKASQQH